MTVGGEDVSLTATEYELLRVLSVNAGRVVTYRALQHQIWSRRGSDEQELARAFIRKLRGKLGDDARNPTYIFNVRGTGYRMPRPDGSPQSS